MIMVNVKVVPKWPVEVSHSQNMKTNIDDLLFLDIDEAQALLDKQDPGYEIAVAKSGLAFIANEKGRVEVTIWPRGVELTDALGIPREAVL